MKKTLILFTLCCCQFLPAISQKIKFNSDWLFQRLDGIERNYEIVNQGTNWEDQFNITHTALDSELKVAEDTLKTEFQEIYSRGWEPVTLPHIPKVEDLVVLRQWQGICYYKKEIEYSPKWNNKKILLEFEGAMHLADIWVNGQHIMQHAGGYDPFVIDLTGLLHTDKKNEVLVRLDNRNNPLIPPGKPLETLDFCYYGGIYRNVNLILKPQEVFISHPILANEIAGGGVFITYPKVSEELAEVNVKTHIVNESHAKKELSINQSLVELKGLYGNYRKGKIVASDENKMHLDGNQSLHLNQLLSVNQPRLWSTEVPNLYLLVTKVYNGDKLVEQQEKINI